MLLKGQGAVHGFPVVERGVFPSSPSEVNHSEIMQGHGKLCKECKVIKNH